jgi:conjugative transfer signal peptidase TraF
VRREGLVLLVFLLAGSLLVLLSPVHLNLSASLPVGVYRSVQQPLRRGALVAVCLPPAIAAFGLRRGYVRPGSCASGVQPLVKPIGALAGDTLDIRAARILVNGQPLAHSATRTQDRHGRRLTHVAWGERRVAAGTVWLFATHHPRSWDSRYFGPVAVETIQSGVTSVWTWEEAA